MEIIMGLLIFFAVGFICLIGLGTLVYWITSIVIPLAIFLLIIFIILDNKENIGKVASILVISIIAKYIAGYFYGIGSMIWR